MKRRASPKPETYREEYIAVAGVAGDKDGPLFRSTGRSTGTPHQMTQQDGYRLIQRHARRASIKTRVSNHSMRATGTTDYPTWVRHLAGLDVSAQVRYAITQGKAPSFFVMNGHDLMMILSETISLTEFLRKRVRLLAEEGRMCVPFSEVALNP